MGSWSRLGGTTGKNGIRYMLPLEGSEEGKDSSAIYRNCIITSDGSAAKELMGTWVSTDGKSPCTSAYDLFCLGMDKTSSQKCTGTIKPDGTVSFKTFKEFHQLSLEIGSGLLVKDGCPEETFPNEKYSQKTYRFVGIYSKNREEWAATDLAANAYDLCLVPLYDTLGPEALQHICKQTQLKTVIAQGENVENLLKALDSDKKGKKELKVKLVVSMDPLTQAMKSAAEAGGVELIDWGTLREVGAADLKATCPTKDPSRVQTLCYTSGTTGLPKGVIITHKMLIAGAASAHAHLAAIGVELDDKQAYLSYLPFAHIFERIVFATVQSGGAEITFYRGDTTKLVDDIGIVRPTIFASVPRLFSRIYDKIVAKVEAGGALKKMLFNTAMNSKLARLRSTGCCTHALWDALVFGNTKRVLGGRVQCLISGSAPINPKVHEFLKCAFAAPFCEGYGLTETLGGTFVSHTLESEVGTIGGVLPAYECKLVSLPEMDYTVLDKTDSGESAPRGELCIRGPAVFPGYFGEPGMTAEALKDGWMHTGDIAQIMPNGATKIVDRKKNLFKLAQGEYVAPEKIEGVYQQAPLVAQAFVYGSSSESACVGVFAISEEDATLWAKQHGNKADWKKLPDDKEFAAAVEKQLQDVAASNKLSGLEKVRAFRLVTEPFSVENDLLTPTFKLKRYQAGKRFAKEIQQMYEELGSKKA